MRILFLTMNNFDDVEEHSIYPDLIRCLVRKGHHVTVLLPREKKYGDKTSCVEKNNVKVIKVRTGNLFNVGMKTKLISRARLCRQYERALKQRASDERYDLVLSSTPPTIFYPLVRKVKKRDGARSYLMLKDIFPQNAVDLGLIADKGLIHKVLRVFEKKLYAVSDAIGCMSPANVEYLLKQDPWIDRKKVSLCPNALEIMPFPKVDRGRVREKYGIPRDKVIFIYGGSIGRPQGIDFFLECIERIHTSNEYEFLVIGSGPYVEKLKLSAKGHEHLLKVIPWLPIDDFNEVVASSDVGLVLLDHRFKIPNFPSRMLSYMQAGLPIAAATDRNSDVGKIVEENNFGLWCESKAPGDFVDMVEKLLDGELRKQMGVSSRKYFEENHDVEKVADAIVATVGKR